MAKTSSDDWPSIFDVGMAVVTIVVYIAKTWFDEDGDK